VRSLRKVSSLTMNPKGVIFDLDGTLTDTEDLQFLGWVEALKPHGVNFTREEYFDYAGRKRLEIDAALIKRYGLDIPFGSLAKAKNRLLDEWFKTKELPLTKSALEIIDFLLKKGIKIAVVSNCRKEELQDKLKGSGLGGYFEIQICLDDVEKPKPHPDLYLKACEKLELAPQDCLAFEDTQAGVESAKAAELTCFAVPNEYTKGQDFSRADQVFMGGLPEAIGFLSEI
jgi:beta-phosphoglucomutase